MPPDSALSTTLRRLRKASRLSQLELSLCLGVSQRHVSFVESGRAKPSRELLMAWLQELQAPMVLRNEAMLQAGYAPDYGGELLDDPALAQINQALHQLLTTHDPMPALVIDGEWNLVQLNRGGMWLAGVLMPGAVIDFAAAEPINLLDLLVHPEGFAKPIINLQEVGPALLARLRGEAAVQPGLVPRVEAFEQFLGDRLGPQSLNFDPAPATAPVLTTRYATEYGELAFFSMFTTFGTLPEISLASLRVEHMFAADETTHQTLSKAMK